MDSIRKTTPENTNKQVDYGVAIANRVYDLLKERNMTQRDFAKALNKTETEVSRWLSGTHNLTLSSIAKWQPFLETTSSLPHIHFTRTRFQTLSNMPQALQKRFTHKEVKFR